MNISNLSYAPNTLDQRTPNGLRKSNRPANGQSFSHLGPRQDHRGFGNFGRDDRQYLQSSFISQQDAPYFANSQLSNDYSINRDKSFQQKSYIQKAQEEYTPQYTKRYEPIRRAETARTPNIYPTNSPFEVYQARPLALQRIINISYYINGLIVFVTSLLFLYFNLSFINLWIDKEEFSVHSFGFLKILLILSFVLFSKALMLRPYDQHINWVDRARALFSQISLANLAIFFVSIGVFAFTYDVFCFLKQVVEEAEIERIIVIAGLNSILGLARFLAKKDHLLDTLSFETNWSYLSIYHPRNLSVFAVESVKFSFYVNLVSSLLCYSGFVSLVFEETLSIFQYGGLNYPGFWTALERFCRDFVIVWCANFIIDVQTQILKRVWIRILNGIGSTRYSLQPLYYFNDLADGDEILISHCLRFLDTKIRYECRNALLLRQNYADPESKTVWHIFVDTTLQQLEKINFELQRLKASNLVLTGSIHPRSSQDKFMLMLEQLFTSSHEVKGLKHLYYELNKATHQYRVITRVFREIKILNLDNSIRNFSINLQTYYRGLTNAVSALDHIKQINKSIYVHSFLRRIQPFEEAIKESLLILNKFVITQ